MLRLQPLYRPVAMSLPAIDMQAMTEFSGSARGGMPSSGDSEQFVVKAMTLAETFT